MSVDITLNPREIKQISQPRQVSSSRLKDLARSALALATKVEKEWSDFSPEERNLIEAIIYESITERTNIRSFISNLSFRLSLAWILIKGETDALIEYFNALQRLKVVVLNAIEREHPEYEQKMTAALQSALAESVNSSAMTTEEFRDWLTNV